MKCKPNCALGGTLSKTRLASCSGGGYWQAAPARYWPDTWDSKGWMLGGNCAPGGTLSKTRLASCSGGILAGSTDEYWRAAPARSAGYLAGYLAGSTGQDPLASCSGGMLGGIHWRAALAGHLAGSTRAALVASTWRDPLASRSGGELLWRDTRRSTGEPLWRDTRRDPLASRSGGILGYWAGSTGEQLWRDTRLDPLASCSGGILGGIHWRAALAGYWVGAWCRSIANADSNTKSNNPFLSGGEKCVAGAYVEKGQKLYPQTCQICLP